MTHRRRTLAWLLGLALLAGGCVSAEGDGSAGTHRARFPGGQKVFINHRGTLTRIQEPRHHMANARRAFEHGRFTLAAIEVEKVAGGVRWFAEHAHGQRRRDIEEAARALRKLEKMLRRREVDSIRVLDEAFADTLRAIEGGPAGPRG